MSSIDTPLYTDPAHLAKLKVQARSASGGNETDNLREVARQFESLFTHMLMKNMRAASLGDGAFDSDQSKFYQDMFDQQLSTELTNGNGLGIADLLVKQLGGGVTPQSDSPVSTRSKMPEHLSLASESLKPGSANVSQPATPQFASLVSTRSKMPGHLSLVSEPMKLGSVNASQPATPVPAHLKIPAHTSLIPEPRVSVMAAGDSGISGPLDFVRKALPHARRIGKQLGVAPQLILAQAALESGWGQKVIRNSDGSNSNNLFGIKAGSGWRGSTAVVNTLEFASGVAERIKAPFRSYESMVESFNDYARLLLKNPRYQEVVGSGEDSAAFAGALQSAGYATDPEYANKIVSIVNSETLKNAMHITRQTQQR